MIQWPLQKKNEKKTDLLENGSLQFSEFVFHINPQIGLERVPVRCEPRERERERDASKRRRNE